MTASILPNPFMTVDPFELIVWLMIEDMAAVVATVSAQRLRSGKAIRS
jgi:hypothetical protein